MSPPAPLLHAPPLLWAAARVLISTIFALFGEPSAIAAQHTHTKPERSLLLKWLRAGEALMRHLLLIEAAEVAKPNTRPLLREARAKRVRREVWFTADNPEDWRVSFRCFHFPPRRGGSVELPRKREETKGDVARRAPSDAFGVSSPARGGGKRFYSAWPLAERAEAMLRVFNNPEPYARRLASRLHATPYRAAALTRHPLNLPQFIDATDFAALRENAATARRRFDSGQPRC